MILYCSECDNYEIRDAERVCPVCGEQEIELEEVDILNHLKDLQDQRYEE